MTGTGAVLCLWEPLPEQMEVLQISCQSRIGSTAGDICKESPVLPGRGSGSLEAIVTVRVDAPQGQLKLCK